MNRLGEISFGSALLSENRQCFSFTSDPARIYYGYTHTSPLLLMIQTVPVLCECER